MGPLGFRSCVALAACLVLLPGLALAEQAAQPERKDAKKPRKKRVLVTISKETTFITEPLREDGYPDYLAALNQYASEGVTVENNAAVPLWQAFGPEDMPEELRERFFKMLGIAPLPEEGDYCIGFDEFAKKHPELKPKPDQAADGLDDTDDFEWDLYDRATSEPWTEEENPLAAAWLKANSKPLALIEEATRRPRRYEPLVASDESHMIIAVLLPGVQRQREAARLLQCRANLRLGQGKPEEAFEDTLACHRLARLAGEGQTLIDGLVAIAIDGVANSGDNRIIAHGNLSAAQARKMLERLQALKPLPPMVEKLNRGERFMYLDAVCLFARKGLSELDSLVDGDGVAEGIVGNLVSWAARMTMDWDLILRMGNQWYDRMVDAWKQPTRQARQIAMAAIDEDINELATKARDPKRMALRMLGGTRKVVSEQIGSILVALLLPAVNAAQTAEDRGIMLRQMSEVGYALAAYRAEKGKYPAKLDDLVPKYVEKVPEDCFSGQTVRYRTEGDGFVLYSVGMNGEDDDGHGYDDRIDGRPETQDWDDLAVRVPGKRERND